MMRKKRVRFRKPSRVPKWICKGRNKVRGKKGAKSEAAQDGENQFPSKSSAQIQFTGGSNAEATCKTRNKMIRKARRFLSQNSGERIPWNDQLAYFHLRHLVVANWRIKFKFSVRNEIWENSQNWRCPATDKQVQCWKSSQPVSSKRKLKIKSLISL